jgi:hypothetical protein
MPAQQVKDISLLYVMLWLTWSYEGVFRSGAVGSESAAGGPLPGEVEHSSG